MKRLKKLLVLVIVCLLIISLAAGCATEPVKPSTSAMPPPSQGNVPTADDGSIEAVYANIEPLTTPTKLRIGVTAGVLHCLPSIIPDMLNAYKNLGIDVEILYFSNGPLMVESLASDGWDCGSYGIGGVLGGPISQNALLVGYGVSEQAGQAIFVRKDSDIAKAGELPGHPGVYGNAETWKGKEIFIPTGTTLHYVLGKGLNLMGISDSDVKLTHMDAGNVNTALYANQGDIWALWNNYAYAEHVNQNFLKAMDGNTAGVTLVAALTANPKSFSDPVKREAIKKWMEVYYKTVDWIKKDSKNQEKLIEYYKQWNDDQGVKGEISDLAAMVKNTPFFTLEENYNLFTAKSDDGTMLKAEQLAIDPLDFFIGAGNYKPEDRQKFLDNKVNAELLIELCKK